MNFGPKSEQGLRLMLEAVADTQNHPTAPLTPDGMAAELAEIAALRGRPAFYPYLGAGVGRGARAMLADGRWVLDFALGIGVHLFGHGNLDLIKTAIRAATSDLVMQGNLVFNRQYHYLMKTLLAHAPGGMEQCWPLLSGADANENRRNVIPTNRD